MTKLIFPVFSGLIVIGLVMLVFRWLGKRERILEIKKMEKSLALEGDESLMLLLKKAKTLEEKEEILSFAKEKIADPSPIGAGMKNHVESSFDLPEASIIKPPANMPLCEGDVAGDLNRDNFEVAKGLFPEEGESNIEAFGGLSYPPFLNKDAAHNEEPVQEEALGENDDFSAENALNAIEAEEEDSPGLDEDNLIWDNQGELADGDYSSQEENNKGTEKAEDDSVEEYTVELGKTRVIE